MNYFYLKFWINKNVKNQSRVGISVIWRDKKIDSMGLCCIFWRTFWFTMLLKMDFTNKQNRDMVKLYNENDRSGVIWNICKIQKGNNKLGLNYWTIIASRWFGLFAKPRRKYGDRIDSEIKENWANEVKLTLKPKQTHGVLSISWSLMRLLSRGKHVQIHFSCADTFYTFYKI